MSEPDEFHPAEVKTPTLRLVIKSDLLILEGSWVLDPESSASVYDMEGLPVNYDYLIQFNGNNFLIYPDDIDTISRLDLTISQNVSLTFRVISPIGSVQQIHVHGKLVPDHVATRFTPGISLDLYGLQAEILGPFLDGSEDPIEIFQPIRDNTTNTIDFRWVLLNAAARRVWGDCTGRSLGQTFPERMALIKKHLIAVTEGLDAESLEYKDNISHKWYRLTARRVNNGVAVTSSDFTIRKNAEILNKRSHQILESMNDACFELDDSGTIIFVNRKGEELVKRRKEAMLGRNVWGVFPELVSTSCYHSVQIIGLEQKEYSQNEFPSGLFGRWISLRVTPTEDGCIVLFHEIEDIANARKTLREEHRRLKEAQAIGHIGSFEWDAERDKYYWSDEMYRILHLEPQSRTITFQTLLQFVYPEDKAWILEKLTQARQDTCTEKMVHRLLLKSGEVRYVRTNLESFGEPGSAVTHISGTVQDITDIKRAGDELKKNLQILTQTEEVAEMGSWQFDCESKKLYWSDGMYRIFGMDNTEEVTLETNLEYAIDEHKGIVQKTIDTLRYDPIPFVEMWKIKTKEKTKTIRVKAIVNRDEAGHPVKVIGLNLDVTALSESERAVREQSHFISNIVKTVPDMISVINLSTGKTEYSNKDFFQPSTTAGVRPLDVNQMLTLIHPDDIGAVQTYFRTFSSLPDDVVNTVEYRSKTNGGDWQWFRSHGRVFGRSAEGVPTHCVNVVQNITDAKKSQDELIEVKEALARQAETKYEELFRSIDQGFAIIEMIYDGNGRAVDYRFDQTNPAVERLTGLKDAPGKTLHELIPDAPQEWINTFGKIAATDQPQRFTLWTEHFNGKWFDIYAFPTGDDPSKKVAILFNDITERIRSDEILRDKQLKLEIAQRAARVGIWTYNPTLHHGVATQEWMELTGYHGSLEEWNRDEFLSLVDAEDVRAVAEALETAKHKTGIDVEFRIQHPDRGLQWFLMRGSYIASENEVNDALMGSIIDITDRKAFEEQKDQFIGIASHELKTPVTSIKAYAEILHHFLGKQGASTESKMMERMVSQIDRLTRLINDLLDTTKISGGGLVLELENVDINKLVYDSVEEMQQATTHHLYVRAEKELPEVIADKDRVGQVLTNLLSNAIKYSPEGSDIIITTEKRKNDVVVKVRDFGIGLPAEVQDKIFDRFYRVNDARLQTVPGLGLGLFIASEIIRKHNGIMGVSSEQGIGSEFSFSLPVT